MRTLIIVTFVFFINFSFSQIKKDSCFFMQYAVGFNGLKSNAKSSYKYGIDIFEAPGKMWFYHKFGVKYYIDRTFGIHLEGIMRVQNLDKLNVVNHLENRFENYEFVSVNILDRRASQLGWKGSMSYFFYLNKITLDPFVSFGMQIETVYSYDYVLRIKSTNYFNKYIVENKSKANFVYSVGANIGLKSHPIFSLNTEFGTFIKSNRYNVKIINERGVESTDIVSTNSRNYFWQLGVNFKFLLLKQTY